MTRWKIRKRVSARRPRTDDLQPWYLPGLNPMSLLFRSATTTSLLTVCLQLAWLTSIGTAAEEVAVQVTILAESALAIPEENVRIRRDGTVQFRDTAKAALSLKPKQGLKVGDWDLQFEAFCLGEASSVTLNMKRPDAEAVSLSLPNILHSEAFTTYTASLDAEVSKATDFQLHIKLKANTSLQIRTIRFVPRSPNSRSNRAKLQSTTSSTALLSSYLNGTLPGHIASIKATRDKLVLEGNVPVGTTSISLAEVPMATLLSSTSPFRSAIALDVKPDGHFRANITRFDVDGKDRALSRWRLVEERGTHLEPYSHCKYVETMHCLRPNLPAAKVATKKGLGGWHISRSKQTENDLVDLGISAVTININAMHDLVSPESRPGWPPFQWQGQTYFANPQRLNSIDRTLLEAQKHDVMVSVILLVTNPKGKGSQNAKLLANPEADAAGIFAMPNVTSEEGLQYYGAILKLMAERWTRPDGRYGRIHHWIMHNEVDFGWVWTNAGRKSDLQFMSLYHRSMRLADLIVRQYDPNARVWISLTHHWASTGTSDGYSSKRILELLLKYCKAEGDFPWAVAYHPYPQDLRNPRTWEDDQATFGFDTHKITPKNLEVLDAWMQRPEMKYKGDVRPVHLSENGLNSPNYSQASLNDQAAGMALAWKKMQHLSSIQMWHYHNWIDNRHEGGLRIGLRKFPDDKQNPYAAKPIWYLYQALETDNEDRILRPYLKTIGASSWEELMHSEAIR